MSIVIRDQLSGLRALLVEDVPSLRKTLRWMLEAEGATVLEASTAGEAVALASTHALDVVLTDLGLPDLSGEAVVVSIRSAARGRIPIAVISGAFEHELARALRAGAERAFRKPPDWDSVIRYLAGKTRVERGAA